MSAKELIQANLEVVVGNAPDLTARFYATLFERHPELQTLFGRRSAEAQQRMLEILQFKLDVLWSMLDAMSMAYELERPPYHSVTRERVWHRGIAL